MLNARTGRDEAYAVIIYGKGSPVVRLYATLDDARRGAVATLVDFCDARKMLDTFPTTRTLDDYVDLRDTIREHGYDCVIEGMGIAFNVPELANP